MGILSQTLTPALAIGFVATTGLAGTGVADLALSQELIRREIISRADLSGNARLEVIMSTLEVHPGAVIPRHFHHGDEHLFVIESGAIETLDGSPVNLATGSAMHFARGEVHGGLRFTGDRPVRVLTVHIVDKDKPLTNAAE